MIKHWLITGDCHAQFERFKYIPQEYKPEETAIIILGDAGINWHCDDKDTPNKIFLSNLGYTYYCVKGNHEQEPGLVPGLELFIDKTVDNFVYADPTYPNIKFLLNGVDYTLMDNQSMIALGGAYSVDKEWRLLNGHKWFSMEQIDKPGQDLIADLIKGNHYNYVFSHTCPYSWRPVDKFIPFIDQSEVDNRTELWLEAIKESITYDYWFMGHHHISRILNENKAYFLYENIIDLKKSEPIYY